MKEIEDKKEFIPYYVFNEGIYLEEIKEAIDKPTNLIMHKTKYNQQNSYLMQDTVKVFV